MFAASVARLRTHRATPKATLAALDKIAYMGKRGAWPRQGKDSTPERKNNFPAYDAKWTQPDIVPIMERRKQDNRVMKLQSDQVPSQEAPRKVLLLPPQRLPRIQKRGGGGFGSWRRQFDPSGPTSEHTQVFDIDDDDLDGALPTEIPGQASPELARCDDAVVAVSYAKVGKPDAPILRQAVYKGRCMKGVFAAEPLPEGYCPCVSGLRTHKGDWNRFDREDREPPDSHAVLAPHEPAVREFMQSGFLVLMPGYKQEVIQLVLRAPCALEDALSEISDARSADNSERFDCLVPATPQPDISFGTVLAVPEWASVYGCCVVADLRLVDNRLFAYLINGRLNRSSLLLQLGVADAVGLRVYLGHALMEEQGMYSFQEGLTISVVPAGRLLAPKASLESLLEGIRAWVMPCPNFPGRHQIAFLVLHEGGHRVLPIDVEEVQLSQDFKTAAAASLGFEFACTTVCRPPGQRIIIVDRQKLLEEPTPTGALDLARGDTQAGAVPGIATESISRGIICDLLQGTWFKMDYGAALTITHRGSQYRLPVVDAYKHLGGIATASETPVPEIWFRHSLGMGMSPPMALLHCCICHLLTVHWHEAPKDAWLGHIAGDVVHVAQYCSAAQTLIDAGSPMDFLNEATRDDPSWWVRQVKKACSEVQKDFEQWRKHGARPEAGGDASLPGVTEPAARDFPCAWCGARRPAYISLLLPRDWII
ncbi:hypothetical protein AK812_SmicGene43975 [Symbiodinium microadriaticum]|uniref:Uncharacterized protein n=1 Tax=Symbiodinium microadriaticum TaxID=2951 RepID=A0A1Q9BZM1_SYMMI|nr:hypothetical protein AK812_SmicGene43975 [Symbiodinium microadriaticum]